MRTFHEYKGIEVSGKVVYGLVQAFGQFKAVASQYLLEEGIGEKGPDGLVVVEPSVWYPMEAQLRALSRFSEGMGDSVVHQIGVSVGRTADEPFPIQDMRTFVKILDEGYHMHHRKHGRAMRELATGQLLEGIGHYQPRGSRLMAPWRSRRTIRTPVPSTKGSCSAACAGLHAVGAILHDDSHSCRKRGKKSCVYVIKV